MAGKHIKFDWAIKRMLRNKANFEILEGFLSELLMFDIKIEEILESEGNKEVENDKFNRVDILVKDVKGNFMLIEVQNESENDYYQRMLYGQAKLISERLNSGDKYGKLTKVYSINIVYFPLGIGKDYVYVSDGGFRGLHYKDELQLSKKQKEMYNAEKVSELFTQYYIIKVNQFDDVAKNTLDEWIYFLKNNEIKDNFQAKGLQKAKERLRVDNLSHDEKIAYDIFIKNRRIRESEIETAFIEGEEKSKKVFEEKLIKAQVREKEAQRQKEEAQRQKEEERRQKEEVKLKLAKTMLKYGETVEDIMRETQLSEEKIKELRIER